MATRFYFNSLGWGEPAPANVTPAEGPGWNATPTQRLIMRTDKRNVPMVARGRAGPGTSGFTAEMYQWVSLPLEAQTISGTVKGMMGVQEVATTDNFFAAFLAKVVNHTGSIVRGTLLSAFGGGTEFPTVSSSIKFPPAWVSPGTALTSVTAERQDRLVIELGIQALSTSVATHNWEFGDQLSRPDYNETEGGTGGTGWIEFSTDINFWKPMPWPVGVP